MKLVFLFIILALLFTLSYKNRRRKILSGTLLAASITLFLLLSIELVYRNFIKPPKKITTTDRMHVPDTLLGYRIMGEGRFNTLRIARPADTIYQKHYTIHADTMEGFPRLPFRKGYQSDRGTGEAVFLGCSFTMGEGLPDEATLPYQFGRIAGISTVNRGVKGYGIHQVYELFKVRYSRMDNAGRIFIYSFIPDHFLRATGIYEWNSTGPHFILEGDSLVNRGVYPAARHARTNRMAHYASGFSSITFIKDFLKREAGKQALKSLGEKDLDAYYRMILELARQAENSGAKLVILFWDHDPFRNSHTRHTDPVSVLEKIKKNLAGTSAEVVPVSTILDYSDKDIYIANDGHPSGKGNGLIAEWLYHRVNAAQNVKPSRGLLQ